MMGSKGIYSIEQNNIVFVTGRGILNKKKPMLHMGRHISECGVAGNKQEKYRNRPEDGETSKHQRQTLDCLLNSA